jgi:RHH-type proline utilization regulon transcriptional repressor/proline dehydrogenase/delta 1-pyrroline-5-carboxylate dehydrogenase
MFDVNEDRRNPVARNADTATDTATDTDTLARLRRRMAARRYQAEPDLLPGLLSAATLEPAVRDRVAARAETLVEAMRDHAARGGGIARFLQEYRLGTPEGILLLCLAESFLRVPDPATADELIRDKLHAGSWRKHVGLSSSLIVNTTTRALSLSQQLIAKADEGGGVIARLVAAGGEPLVRRAVAAALKLIGGQFVMGRSIEEAVERMQADRSRFRYSFDMLGEAARTAASAARYHQAYLDAIRCVGAVRPLELDARARPNISIKLSALHPRYEVAQSRRVLSELRDRVIELVLAAREHGLGIMIDAEEADRLDLSLDLIEAVAAVPELADYRGFGLAVQAYQKRAVPLIAWIDALGAKLDRHFVVRLVKGAYWDSEIKHAQERGLDGYPVFTRKAATDVSYLACARAMLDAHNIFPAFATHNALTAATVLEWAGKRRDFEFQRLFGMGEGLYEPLMKAEGVACRIYAPVGVHRDLLSYLVRRLLENGANTSFVNHVADPQSSVEELLADPATALREAGCTPHPRIPLPADLFGKARKNSRGMDLSDRAVLHDLGVGFDAALAMPYSAKPLIDGRERDGDALPVVDPANTGRVVGMVVQSDFADVERAVALARRSADGWNRHPVEERAACLDRMADLLEADRVALLALLVREAGKTIPDAVAEIREAVDLCRYYAGQAIGQFAPVDLPGPTGEMNQLTLAGRGAFACISPWNFPLAIFLGQVSAALVAGNAAIAKPASQTPLIAYRAIKLFHQAGVPTEVLQLVLGGAEIGAALIGNPNIAGVAFTGSTATARAIGRRLADRNGALVPFIAETGGQNAMIVDSTALPEQVVGDVVASGFYSAGQRCSALRVLYLQEEAAPRILEMLIGAMAEIAVGDPIRIETDVGPVIDQAARARLEAHVSSGIGQTLYRTATGPECQAGWFLPPHLIELDRSERLEGEVFGPVVHVVRWQATHLEKVVDGINATGYGLTLGVHSRINRTVETVRARARVGNLYVNRSMIGAVVGVQPFGGEGLSGTGPKAGGPRYLARFATERTISIDTTSAGGNATLMSLEEDDRAAA